MFNNGSHGIQSEGWTLTITEEGRGGFVESSQSKRGKGRTTKASVCECCGKQYEADLNSRGRFCSYACMYQHKKDQRPHWFECSKCLAAIGLGLNTAPRILGTNKAALGRQWRKEGIRAKLPIGHESWMSYAASRKASGATGKMWWINQEAANGWMSHHGERFFDWSCIWNNETANRASLRKYNSAESIYERTCHSDILLHKRQSVYPDWSSIWTKSRMKMRPDQKAFENLRTRFKQLMGTTKRGGSSFRNDLVGCTTEQLARHLESTFKRGMTWKNYGTRWHVDHIIPCAAFDHTDPKQRAQCWHWTNLRALDAKQNMDKGDKITEPQMSLLLCAAR